MDMFINDKFVCSSKAEYGKPDEGGNSHSHGAGGARDISLTIRSMSPCGEIPVKKGDALSMVVEYDLSKHPL
jgi:hypothetical protein